MRPTALLLGFAALALGAPARAQDAPARVEYLAGGTLYVSVADGSRWLPGDTVRLAPAGAGDWAGRARVLGAAAARLSLDWLSGRIPFSVGDSVRIEVPRARLPEAPVPTAEPPREPPPQPVAEALPPPRPQAGGGRGLRMSGRVGLELDAMNTESEWEGTSLDHTSVLNTMRLRGMLSGLPGGVRVRANLRGSYRHGDADVLGPSAVLFANELALERTGGMLQLQAGRFGSSYEPYSGYWDGALVRVGSLHGAGVGAAYGLDPRYGNQGIEPDRRKATVFADLHRATRTLRYDTDISAHRTWDHDTAVATAIGWTQQLAVGRARITQLLRVDDASDGWTLGLAQLSASLPLGPALRLRLRLTHDDPHGFYQLPAASTWRRRAAGGTLAWYGSGLNAGVDVTATASERGESALDSTVAHERRTATAVGGWLDLPRTAIAGLGFDVQASTWSGYGQRTLSVSPGLRRTFGHSSLRAGYQLYRYEHEAATTSTHAVAGSFSSALGRGQFDVQLRHDWGGSLRSTRVLSGIWIAL